jgi:serine/threonine protein kinase
LEIVRMKDGSAEVQKKSIVDEVVSLRKLAGCRNIIQWEPDVAFDSRRQTIQLYMEFYPDGDLEGFIEKHPAGLIPKDTVTQVFCCLAMALLDCHSRGICHSDIKPANGMLSLFRFGVWYKTEQEQG